MASRKQQKEQARAARLEQERQAAAQAARKRRFAMLGGGAVATIAVAVVAVVLATGGSGANATSGSAAHATSPPGSAGSTQAGMGFEGVPLEAGPLLASAGTTQTGTVDGISCGSSEQTAYHVHTHLAVFWKGKALSLPGGIGIPGSTIQNGTNGPVAQGGQCIYWLHTHAPDGVIHIESPTQRQYTLGNFFDEWHQPLTATQVAGAKGKVTAVVNGKRWTKSVREIPLGSHETVQLSVGSPVVPFKSVSWAATGL